MVLASLSSLSPEPFCEGLTGLPHFSLPLTLLYHQTASLVESAFMPSLSQPQLCHVYNRHSY